MLNDYKVVVELIDIVKRFSEVIANNHVNFVAYSGAINTIIGENGAGKTTLMNILYGIVQKDSGEIKIKGKRVSINTPSDAIKFGINMVHQHMIQMPDLSVLENIVMGRIPRIGFLFDKKEAQKQINKLIERHRFNVRLESKIRELSMGQRQQVEILKCLYKGGNILIFDEPTSVLTPIETKQLFTILRSLAKEGYTIIFISHKLKEVFEISDMITVMRNGENIASRKIEETNPTEIVQLMFGLSGVMKVEKTFITPGEIILKIKNLSVKGPHNIIAVKNLNLEIHEKEIVGIAGVEGNGQKELIESLIGLRKIYDGVIYFKKKCINYLDTKERRKLGISFIPDDRINVGANMKSSVLDNLCALKLTLSSQLVIDWKKIIDVGWDMVNAYDIKVKDIFAPISYLSGGNIQKVIIAREFSFEPKLLITYNPTYGLDIAATEYVHNQIIKARNSGCAVFLISTDLDEILKLSDRIFVMFNGEIVGSFLQKEANEEKLGPFMLGLEKNHYETKDVA